MSDAYMEIVARKKPLIDILADLPDGSLDFVYADYDQTGNTLTISSIPDADKETVNESTTSIQDSSTGTSLPDVLKENSKNTNSHLQIQNENLSEQNRLLGSLVNELKQQSLNQKALIETVNNQTKVQLVQTDVNNILLSELIGSNVGIETAIKNQNLSPNINMNTNAITTAVNQFKSTNENIESHLSKMSSEHIVGESGFYAKQNELLDFNKTGDEDLTDSEGNLIIPRNVKAINNAESVESLTFDKTGHVELKDIDEKQIIPRDVKAVHNAEKAIETQEMNGVTNDDWLYTFDESMIGLDRVVNGLYDDVFDGVSDSISFDNPFGFFVDLVKKSMEDELNDTTANLDKELK